jgi:hypothetical protein
MHFTHNMETIQSKLCIYNIVIEQINCFKYLEKWKTLQKF